jgi:MSHA biogenesis protein MshJ
MPTHFSFSELRDRFSRLSQREQLLMVLVVGAALYFLVDALVYMPQQERMQALITQRHQLQSQVLVLSAEIAAVERTRAENLEQKERDYQRLKKQAALLERVSASLGGEAYPVRALLGEVLGTRQERVTAVGVRTVPAKPMPAVNRAPGQGAALPAMFKHGADLELRGRYLDLVTYLRDLEERYPRLFWSNATLSADGSTPESTLRVSVFMLSTQSNP